MKLTMTSRESGEIVLESQGISRAETILTMVLAHVQLYGENGLDETLLALASIASGDNEYMRIEMSDPESNFDLKLIE